MQFSVGPAEVMEHLLILDASHLDFSKVAAGIEIKGFDQSMGNYSLTILLLPIPYWVRSRK